MTEQLDCVLEACIFQIIHSQATAEQCLARHPDLAIELEPLLHVAARLHSAPHLVLSRQARTRIRKRILAANPAHARRRSVGWHLPRIPAQWRWALVAASILLIIVAVAVLVTYADNSAWPRSPWYLAGVSIGEPSPSVYPGHAETIRQLSLARQRLATIQVFAAGGRIDLEAIDGLARDLHLLLAAIDRMPAPLAQPLIEEMLFLLRWEDQILSDLLPTAPRGMQSDLAAALATVRSQTDQAQALANRLSAASPSPAPIDATSTVEPYEPTPTPQPEERTRTPNPPTPPDQTPTPEPPGQTKTPQPPGQTKTPQPPGQTKTPQPPSQTKTPEPPGQTKTPQPPGQTKTPQPPGQTKTPDPPGHNKTPGPPDPTRTPKATKMPKP